MLGFQKKEHFSNTPSPLDSICQPLCDNREPCHNFPTDTSTHTAVNKVGTPYCSLGKILFPDVAPEAPVHTNRPQSPTSVPPKTTHLNHSIAPVLELHMPVLLAGCATPFLCVPVYNNKQPKVCMPLFYPPPTQKASLEIPAAFSLPFSTVHDRTALFRNNRSPSAPYLPFPHHSLINPQISIRV